MEKKVSKSQRLAASVVNGGIAGFTGLLCTFPIDLSKTRLQNQQVINGKRMYNGLFHCLRTVFKNEGFISLYRGALPNLLLIVPEKTIKLSVNDYMRGVLSKDGKTVTPANQLVAAATAGFFQVFITAPMEMMKIYGQDAGRIHAMNGGAAASPTVVSTRFPVRVIMQQYGIRGFYKGFAATLMRDIPFSMIYFPLFAFLNKLALVLYSDELLYKHLDGSGDVDNTSVDKKPHVPFFHTLICGVVAGGTAAAAVNPADIVKTRLQSIHAGTRKYDGIADCITRIYREEGLRTFCRGAQARAMAIAPLFGIAQSIYCLGLGERIIGIPNSSIL